MVSSMNEQPADAGIWHYETKFVDGIRERQRKLRPTGLIKY